MKLPLMRFVLTVLLLFTGVLCFGQVINSPQGAPCRSKFITSQDGKGIVEFQAIATSGTVWYIWRFGDGDSIVSRQSLVKHHYKKAGTYEVQLETLDSLECSYGSKLTIKVKFKSCIAAYTTQQDTTGGVHFTSTSSPIHSKHIWDFGDGSTSNATNPFHQYRGAGNFSVVLFVNDSTCWDTMSTNISVNATATGTVEGRVTVGGSFAVDGKVYLYRMDSLKQLPILLDTVNISASPITGLYSFRNVGSGKYLIKAVLGDKDPHYGSFMPTYINSASMFWSSVSASQMPNSAGSYYNVQLLAARGSSGPGQINGKVFSGLAGSILPYNETPLLLLDANDNPVASINTDQNGKFEFKNLAFGVYKLTLDHPGMSHTYRFIILNQNRSVSGSNDFLINSNGIALDGSRVEQINSRLYPNPVREILNIEIPDSEIKDGLVEILDLRGKRVLRTEKINCNGNCHLEYDLSALPPGIYMFRLIAEKSYIESRIIKF